MIALAVSFLTILCLLLHSRLRCFIGVCFILVSGKLAVLHSCKKSACDVEDENWQFQRDLTVDGNRFLYFMSNIQKVIFEINFYQCVLCVIQIHRKK